MGQAGDGCGGLWTLLNQGSTEKGDQGTGTAVPMADNGLERHWAMAQGRAW